MGVSVDRADECGDFGGGCLTQEGGVVGELGHPVLVGVGVAAFGGLFLVLYEPPQVWCRFLLS